MNLSGDPTLRCVHVAHVGYYGFLVPSEPFYHVFPWALPASTKPVLSKLFDVLLQARRGKLKLEGKVNASLRRMRHNYAGR